MYKINYHGEIDTFPIRVRVAQRLLYVCDVTHIIPGRRTGHSFQEPITEHPPIKVRQRKSHRWTKFGGKLDKPLVTRSIRLLRFWCYCLEQSSFSRHEKWEGIRSIVGWQRWKPGRREITSILTLRDKSSANVLSTPGRCSGAYT